MILACRRVTASHFAPSRLRYHKFTATQETRLALRLMFIFIKRFSPPGAVARAASRFTFISPRSVCWRGAHFDERRVGRDCDGVCRDDDASLGYFHIASRHEAFIDELAAETLLRSPAEHFMRGRHFSCYFTRVCVS